MTLIAQEYLTKIAKVDAEIARLQAESKRLFYEYLQYLKRMNDPQTDLDDYIHEIELGEKK